ncbi:type II toxin-antitoxin system death-on-curing family toxin [Anaerolineales bacterium]
MNLTNDKPVHYLSASDLYNINDTVMNGHVYVRDIHMLYSAAQRPALRIFGEEQFPRIVDKAAALMHSLAYHHLFADGNKRSAILATRQFLQLNGYHLQVEDTATWQDYLLEIAQGEHEPAEIAHFLESYLTPTGS